MTTFLSVFDGYVMVFMVYLSGNGLLFFTLGKRLRIRWPALLLLTVLESVAVYQILHYVWVGNIAVVFLFFVLLLRATDLEAYKLLYLNMIAVTYTTAINLIYYMIWGPSYTWYWGEVGWMFLAYAFVTPLIQLGIDRWLWPRLSGLDLPASRWLWIMPAFAIIIIMLVGSSHVQFLMMGYEAVYGLTALSVVILSAGVSLLTLVIMQKNQLASTQKHDMELVEVQIAAQSGRFVEVMRQMNEIRIMRHDLRHHVQMINMLMGKEDMEGLRAFVSEMEHDQRLYDNIIYSQNRISDLVAHHAMLVARGAGISLSIRCGLPRSFWVSETDLCVLLGNLLDNALNACRVQQHGRREIVLTCAIHDAEALIILENTCGDASQETNARRERAGIPKSGGYGLLSVRNIAGKYNGMATFNRADGRYTASILLPRPSSVDHPEAVIPQAVPNGIGSKIDVSASDASLSARWKSSTLQSGR